MAASPTGIAVATAEGSALVRDVDGVIRRFGLDQGKYPLQPSEIEKAASILEKGWIKPLGIMKLNDGPLREVLAHSAVQAWDDGLVALRAYLRDNFDFDKKGKTLGLTQAEIAFINAMPIELYGGAVIAVASRIVDMVPESYHNGVLKRYEQAITTFKVVNVSPPSFNRV